MDGYDYYWQSLRYADNIAFACTNVIIREADDGSHWAYFRTNPTARVFENLLFNFGFMWIDIMNYFFYTPENVPQGDWGFFLFYTWGDFISRFFFNP